MTSVPEICRQFLRRETPLDALRDWLADNQWELEGPEEDLADSIDVAIVHLDDGYADESDLRNRLSKALEHYSEIITYQRIIKVVANTLRIDESELSEGSSYVDLDSLDLVEVIMAVEAEFSPIDILGSNVALTTIRELVGYLINQGIEVN